MKAVLSCLFLIASLQAQIDQGPGGPILVLASAGNPFGRYYAEILRTEGLNEFLVADISTVSGATLSAYDLVILGEMPLNSGQVSMLSSYVSGGGRLIAMRPDKQLASLLGLLDQGSTIAQGYIQVNNTVAPGQGIVGDTIQFHDLADRYALNGATAIATLFTSATGATTSPAVSWRAFGSGQAAAFTYDLAKSVVYTKQGNPAWAGQARFHGGTAFPADLFYPDWTDRTKTHIPQADEQMRLLANLILFMNRSAKPLPRFWYLPFGKKFALIMTSDEHNTGYSPNRLALYNSLSTGGCVVANWDCVRGTVYLYQDNGVSDATYAPYQAQGHEISLHFNVPGAYTPAVVNTTLSTQINQFRARYPSLFSPISQRAHGGPPWNDWISQPTYGAIYGVRIDHNYTSDPYAYYNANPGFFTGSAMLMRFANTNGAMVDNYQAPTQIYDNTGQALPNWPNPIFDRGMGGEGYYGFVSALIHSDYSWQDVGASGVIRNAQARGVAVISSRQAATWTEGRNNSSFTGISWSSSRLNFTVTAAAGSTGLRGMVPVNSTSGVLSSLLQNGSSIGYTIQTIKGLDYAFFPAVSANYQAVYGTGGPAPFTVSSVTPSGAGVAITANTLAVFNRNVSAANVNSSTFFLRAAGASTNVTGSYSVSANTATFVPSAPLANSTTYTATLAASVQDTAGVALGSPVSWSFTTVAASALTVTGISPVGTGVSTATVVTATLNRNVNPFSVAASSVSLRASGASSDVPAGLSVSGANITLSPSAALANSVTYTLTLAAGVQDTGGVSLGAPYSWSFTTAAASAPAFAVSAFSPTGSGVSTASAITATFNRNVSLSWITASTFSLRAAGASFDTPGTLSVSSATATLTPSAPLAASTNYTATLSASIQDAAGAATLGSPFTWTFTTAASTPPATGGLVGQWSFSEGSGLTTADSSGNGSTATLSGAANWAPGYSGNGLQFGGGLATAGQPAVLTGHTAFTWAAWARPTGEMGRGQGPVIERGSGSYVVRTMSFGPIGSSAPASVTALVRTGAVNASSETSINSYSLNTWAHWAITYNDAGDRRIHIYRNGVELAYRSQVAATGALTSDVGTTLAFGANPVSPFYSFTGDLDEVRIYNRDLTAAEISALATGAAPPTPPTVTGVTPTGSGVSTATALNATFSRAMNSASITSSTFTLRASGASSNVAANVTASGSSATLTPLAALAAGTTYTATIAASVADPGGVALGSPYAWSFTTAAAASPLTVVSWGPSGPGVATSANFVVSFTRSINPATTSAFTLRAAGAAADTPATVSAIGASATLTPNAALAAGTSYTVTVGAGIADTGGVTLGSPFTWTFTTAGTPPVAGGLQASWSFNEGAGATAADSSGNGATATLAGGAAWAAGRTGTGLSVNNSAIANVGAPAALTGHTAFTWSAWVMATGEMGHGFGPVVERGAGSYTARSFSFGALNSSSPGLVNATVRADGVNAFSEAVTGTYTANVWNHFTVTYDNAGDRRIRIYKNGLEVAYRSQTAANGALSSEVNTNWAIGATPGGAFYSFTGVIDEVKIYNRVLTAAEIQALAN